MNMILCLACGLLLTFRTIAGHVFDETRSKWLAFILALVNTALVVFAFGLIFEAAYGAIELYYSQLGYKV